MGHPLQFAHLLLKPQDTVGQLLNLVVVNRISHSKLRTSPIGVVYVGI
jgi:hypothetical protein